MDTTRVDIYYRPLRIGWAICSGDMDAFRRAVRFSNALWGGRFNPIVGVDYEEEAARLIELFHVDVIYPIGDTERVPRKRFDTFVLLAKLAPFTKEEIKRAESLNDEHHRRAILLTPRELEPYHIYDRVRAEVGTRHYFGGTPKALLK